jgi:hypothetical protein
VQPFVEAVHLRTGLFELGVALEQRWDKGVELERLYHSLGLAPGELGDRPTCEAVGDLHVWAGLLGRDSLNTRHVTPPLAQRLGRR